MKQKKHSWNEVEEFRTRYGVKSNKDKTRRLVEWAISSRKVQIAGVALVGVIAIASVVNITSNAAESKKPKDIYDYSVTAGVTSGFTAKVETITDDTSAQAVVADKLAITTMAGEATEEAVATEETAELSVKERVSQVITGYDNLGVANVDNYLNIRKGAGEGESLCGKLPKNAGCEVLEETNGWYKIKSGNVTGYVKAEYLLTGDAAWQKADEVKVMTATVNTETLFVREAMNTDCKILALVSVDEELEVLEMHEGWAKVNVDSTEGYVSLDYVKISYEIPKGVTLTELSVGSGVSSSQVSIVEYAKQFLGNPYRWGGTSLTNGADCSGFTMALYRKYGVYLPHSSSAQSKMGTKVSSSEAKPGDLFFYGSGSRVNHVAMYIGNGKVIHASTERTGIKISNAYYRTPITIRRFLN